MAMDATTMRAMGKILGEVYRLQQRTDPQMVGVSESTVYGLLHGLEDVLSSELNIQADDGTEMGVSHAEFGR